MTNTAKIIPLPANNNLFNSVIAAELNDSGNQVKVQTTDSPASQNSWARIPVHLQGLIDIGDELLSGGEENNLFIINILAKAKSTPTKIQTFSPEQELLFEYDPKTHKSRVFINEGDLELVTRKGDITLNAAKNINLHSNNLELSAETHINLAVTDSKESRSTLSLDPKHLNLTSPKLGITSQKADLLVEDMHYTGKTCLARMASLRFIGKQLKIAATTINQKAENIFQKITGLSQIRAGRKHEIIDETYHLKSKQAVLKADQDFKIKGEKIHLG
jgi:hypothetical protein